MNHKRADSDEWTWPRYPGPHAVCRRWIRPPGKVSARSCHIAALCQEEKLVGREVCVCVCARTHMCTPLHTSLCWAAKQHSANNLWYFSIYRISAALDSTTFFRGNAPPSILLIQVWEFGSLTHTHTHTHTRIGGNAIQDNKNSFLASPNLKEERHNLSSDKAEDVSWKPLTPWAVAVL